MTDEVTRALRRENTDLHHEVQALREQLRRTTEQLELTRKASRDAWAFAKLAFRGSSRPSP